MRLTHLQRLEAESIHIMREVVAECERPVMLYSIGKDSAVMLQLAIKAFYPAPPPFPLLHIDTTWKFRDMYAMRDRMAKEARMRLLVHTNQEGLARGSPHDREEDRGAEAGARSAPIRCRVRWRPTRRGEQPREGAHLFVSHR